MKIILLGISTTPGRAVLNEALRREHTVTAIARDPANIQQSDPRLRIEQGEIANPAQMAKLERGQDVVVNALEPAPGTNFADLTRKLIDGVERSGVRRLITIGGTGSLETSPGKLLMDTPEFPTAWKSIAQAQYTALEVYRGVATLEWTMISPPIIIDSGKRTARYRTATEQLIKNAKGESHISAADFACAILDEIEHPNFIRQRFTVGY
ncbi:NAD(P)-dependent oxidoreductase [Dictyobacter arantiisoli]|uniref:3-beta hydroxysteroid dehydrogenase n=1 Tax=Dictyobacter arantiisoli TaxID=2014874 RepID=A0A5A5TLJ5_9CHLR|nr:NAD(P)H-binding protein [Dictyobacter arantiisoli]GCF11993.1 3-beta hydroxysteroid dehydrogenase [Dictyobacter arantiisoli]